MLQAKIEIFSLSLQLSSLFWGMTWSETWRTGFPSMRLISSQTSLLLSRHEIYNNVVCATSKGSDQPGHTRRLIRAFASCLIFYDYKGTDRTASGVPKLNRRLHRLA